jgi:hypothetical protein
MSITGRPWIGKNALVADCWQGGGVTGMQRFNGWTDDVWIRLEAVFEDGRALIVSEVGASGRSDLKTPPGAAYGLPPAEGKTLFARLQSALCQDQMHAAARPDRVFRRCGTQRPLKIQEPRQSRAFSAKPP